MKIQCKTCGAGYKIDPAKIKKQTIRIKCKKCGGMINIKKQVVTSEKKPTLSPKTSSSGKTLQPEIKRSNRLSGYQKLTLAAALILLITLIVFGYLMNHYSQTLLTEGAKNELMQNTKINAAIVSRYFDQKTSLAYTVSKNTEVIRASKEQAVGLRGPHPTPEPVDGKMREVTRTKAQLFLSQIYALYKDELVNLFIADVYGYIMADGLNGTSVGLPLIQPGHKDGAWQKTFAGHAVFDAFRLVEKSGSDPVLSSTLFVPMKDNGGVFGLVGVSIDCTDLEKTIAENHPGINGYTILTDKSGSILVHPEKKFRLNKKLAALPGTGFSAFGQKLFELQSGFTMIRLNEISHFVYFDRVGPAGKYFDMELSIASIISENDFRAKIDEIRKNMGIPLLIALLLSFFILGVAARPHKA